MLPYHDVAPPPHDLYHISPKEFDFPCRKKIFEAREWSRWHKNGVLGLWCSTFPKMCAAFGGFAYKVELVEDAKAIGLPFGPFQKLTSELEDFTGLIDFLCSKGDIAYLVDAQGCIGEVIVLNFDRIKTFTNVTDTDLKDVRVPWGEFA